jgi:hypothetical protein
VEHKEFFLATKYTHLNDLFEGKPSERQSIYIRDISPKYIDEPNRTYAAVAARASDDLAGVRRETRSKKKRIEQLINTSLHLVFLITSRIHRGHINMKMPRPSRTISAQMSTRLSL